MKKVVLSVVAAFALTTSAFAADMPVKAAKAAPAPPPSMWDVAFGAAIASDYRLRGVSQTDRKMMVNGYIEPRFTVTDWLQLYVGVSGYNMAPYNAAGEFDVYGGARLSWGQFGLDLGYVYYYYPDGTTGIGTYGSFGDFYVKPSFKFNDWLTVGAVVDWGYNNNGGFGIVGSKNEGYYSANAVITLPWNWNGVTVAINPEVGRQWASCTGCTSFTYWDAGLDFMYKAATLDLRYWSTSASGAFLGSPLYGSKNLSGPAFVVTLKFDATINGMK